MIEPLVRNRLLDLVGGRVHIGTVPRQVRTPYLRITLVSGDRDWTLAGSSGARFAAVQIDCWADSPMVAAETMEEVLLALEVVGDDFGCNGVNDLSSEDDEMNTKRHRASMEFFLTS